MKRGQGLPLSFIVIAAIVVLVLVLVVVFTTGSLGKLFGTTETIGESVTPEETTAFKIGCEQACQIARQLSDTADEWKATDYCTRTIKLNTTLGLQDVHCWQSPVTAQCSKDTSQGRLDQTTC